MTRHVRAAVPSLVLETVAGRAPDAEVVAVDELQDLSTLDFMVPIPYEQGSLVERLPALERLAVIQTLSAGVDALEGHVPAHVTLCSARGARDGAVAEWVLGALLGTTTRIVEKHGARHWERAERVGDLHGSTVLIVGMGSIGRRVAELASAFPTAGGLYWWASRLGGPAWGWFTGWFNLIGQIGITAGIDYGAADRGHGAGRRGHHRYFGRRACG